jgi:phenylacetyl-CoA:acceptor oxidoreductase
MRTGLLQEYNEAINRGAGVGVPLKSSLYDYALDPTRPYTAEEIWDRVCRAATMTLTQGKEEKGLQWFKARGAFFVPFPEKRIKRVGEELKSRLHEHGMRWWEPQLAEYQALPPWKDFPDIWVDIARQYGKRPEDYPFWLLTSRSMQYSWGSNVSLPILADVAHHVTVHFGVMLNRQTAQAIKVRDGDGVWIESPIGKTKGRALLLEGIRPDVIVALQQFGHWVTPFAKDLHMPNMNTLTPMGLSLTDATGSGADLVRVKVTRA